jgi:cytochrome c peroxidase
MRPTHRIVALWAMAAAGYGCVGTIDGDSETSTGADPFPAPASAPGAVPEEPPAVMPEGPVAEEFAEASSTLFHIRSAVPTGTAVTTSPTRLDLSPRNPFFTNFGTNQRTCGTCHAINQGWSITPTAVRTLALNHPIFVFDGSDCLPPGVPNPDPRIHSTETRLYGNIRVDLPIPRNADFVLERYVDTKRCPTPPSAANIRVYRRPLPTANVAFLATVMWDGRENVTQNNTDNLKHQSNEATIGHAQATRVLTDGERTNIVNFELGKFNAQLTVGSLALNTNGGNGGAEYIYRNVLPNFFIGINDPFLPGFTSVIFDVFKNWEPGGPTPPPNAQAAAIGRGERIFNTRRINITNVAGLNGPNDASQAPIQGFCGTCHDSPNIGNHSVSLPIDIGISAVNPVGGLDVRHLPVYTFRQVSTGRRITLTDPGRALISGRFVDMGKMKGPTLRSLASRAPYFHNGSARDLATVIRFYDERFAIGFTAQERSDLAAFLGAL